MKQDSYNCSSHQPVIGSNGKLFTGLYYMTKNIEYQYIIYVDKICKTDKKTNNAKMSSIKYKNYKRLNLLSHNKLFMFAHSHESYYFIINKVKSHYLNVNNAHLPLIGYKNIIASKPQMYKEQFKSHRLFKIIKRNRGFVLFNE